MGLGSDWNIRWVGPGSMKEITAKDIRAANRVLKKGRKFNKLKKGITSYSTRKQFVAPPKGKKKLKQEEKDLNLVYDYGTKAQKAKSFGRGKTVDGSKTPTKKIKPKKKDPYTEGTGIPKGQKGTPPPSIFEQKKKKIKKKGGGKITYRMTGGQVVDSGYD